MIKMIFGLVLWALLLCGCVSYSGCISYSEPDYTFLSSLEKPKLETCVDLGYTIELDFQPLLSYRLNETLAKAVHNFDERRYSAGIVSAPPGKLFADYDEGLIDFSPAGYLPNRPNRVPKPGGHRSHREKKINTVFILLEGTIADVVIKRFHFYEPDYDPRPGKILLPEALFLLLEIDGERVPVYMGDGGWIVIGEDGHLDQFTAEGYEPPLNEQAYQWYFKTQNQTEEMAFMELYFLSGIKDFKKGDTICFLALMDPIKARNYNIADHPDRQLNWADTIPAIRKKEREDTSGIFDLSMFEHHVFKYFGYRSGEPGNGIFRSKTALLDYYRRNAKKILADYYGGIEGTLYR